MTMLRQLSDRNQRRRTFEPRHVTLVCLLLLLLVVCFGLLYEVKPCSLKNRRHEISPFGRKELRLRVAGQVSESKRIEEKEEKIGGKRGEIIKLQESKVDEDSEVGDDERDVASDGETEEEEELEEIDDDLVDEEEELEEEEKEDEERER